jgi:hypothetical protein
MIRYDFTEFEGPQAMDRVAIGDRVLFEQQFLDATNIHGEFFSWYLDYDCVLGLAPFRITPIPFSNT